MALQYFSGQGKVYVMTRDTSGNPLAGRWVGNVPMFKFSLTEDVEEHKESYTGNRLTDVRLTKELKAEVEFEAEQLDTNNINLLLWGATVSQTSGTVTGEELGVSGNAAVGNVWIMANKNIDTTTGLAVVDSTSGSAKTLTLDTHFTLDGDSGTLEIISVTGGPYKLPLIAEYDKGAATYSKMFGSAAVEYWIRFVGINTAVSGSPNVTVDLYRCRLSPSEEMGLISDEVSKFAIKGSVLADDTKTASSDFGQFGSMYQAA